MATLSGSTLSRPIEDEALPSGESFIFLPANQELNPLAHSLLGHCRRQLSFVLPRTIDRLCSRYSILSSLWIPKPQCPGWDSPLVPPEATIAWTIRQAAAPQRRARQRRLISVALSWPFASQTTPRVGSMPTHALAPHQQHSSTTPTDARSGAEAIRGWPFLFAVETQLAASLPQ